MPLTLMVIVMAIVAWVWLSNQPRSQRKPAILKLVLIAGIPVAIFLVVRGLLPVLLALLAFLFPILRRVLPSILMRGMSGAGGAEAKSKPGSQSHVSSDILNMTLDHDSGNMSGEILKGPMAGRALADLGESEFIELLHYCRDHDEDSARLLETYLDRRFGDSWRTDDPTGDDSAGENERESSDSDGSLTEREALDILGLEAGASRDEIIQAHRRMMQKLHPDRGGSNYLAARVNEAKEQLLS